MDIRVSGGSIHWTENGGNYGMPAYMVGSDQPFLVNAVAPAVVDTNYDAKFDSKTALVVYNGQAYTPDTYTDIAEADVKAFAEAIYTNGGERLYAAKQRLEALKNDS